MLAATVKNGELQQIAMMGVAKAADAADDTPSFVLAPITQASYYWIGAMIPEEYLSTIQVHQAT